MNTSNLDYYKRSGYFFFSYYRENDGFFIPRTCKELICNDVLKVESPIYFLAHGKTKEIFGKYQEYLKLLGVNVPSVFEKDRDYPRIVVNGENKIDREIACFILASFMHDETFINKEVSWKSFLETRYFTKYSGSPLLKAVFPRISEFLPLVTEEHLKSCKYNFDRLDYHGGLMDWLYYEETFDDVLKEIGIDKSKF